MFQPRPIGGGTAIPSGRPGDTVPAVTEQPGSHTVVVRADGPDHVLDGGDRLDAVAFGAYLAWQVPNTAIRLYADVNAAFATELSRLLTQPVDLIAIP